MYIARRCSGLAGAVALAAAVSALGCSSNTGSGPGSKASAPSGTGGAGAGGSGGSSGKPALAMNECGLHTAYAGDENCILPPPPDKGFQVHIGPTDYDNPEAAFVLQPGAEATTNFPAVSGNDHDVFFYYRQYRLRPSAHHIILTVPNGSNPSAGSSIAGGRRIGTANLSEDFPAGGVIAPEDLGVGSPLAPKTAINASFHTINTSDKPALREAWINFWYRDPSEITDPATEWFKTGDIGLSVAPFESKTLGPYTCTVDKPGRMLWMYGHRHANNTRFTATRIRGAQRDVIYDANKWEEPVLLEFSSLVTNPAPDIPNGVEGGWNGILDFLAGDKIEWSCDVVNTHDVTLRFTDQTLTGEMCIIDAEAVGSNCR